MQASSWVEQEHLDERLAELEAQKAELAADLQAAQVELSTARASLAAQEVTMRKLSEQLLKEGEAVVKLKAQLTKEQTLVKTLKTKTNKVSCIASLVFSCLCYCKGLLFLTVPDVILCLRRSAPQRLFCYMTLYATCLLSVNQNLA